MSHSLPHLGRTSDASEARRYWKRASKGCNEMAQYWLTDHWDLEYAKRMVKLFSLNRFTASDGFVVAYETLNCRNEALRK
jgi:hypothetical protein